MAAIAIGILILKSQPNGSHCHKQSHGKATGAHLVALILLAYDFISSLLLTRSTFLSLTIEPSGK